ncbi:MAG: ribosome maturation factor RimP [Thiohalocapsa sp.]
MQAANPAVTALIETVVGPMGYEPVGVEFVQGPAGSAVLRVYIDHEDGIKLEDCETVSRQLSSVFDVEDPIPGRYDLEVSSPGLDRPLFKIEHFDRFSGERARIRLVSKLDGRRRFEGVLAGTDGSRVLLDADGERLELPHELIETARLIPEY